MSIDFENMEAPREYKLRSGQYLKRTKVWREGAHIYFKFGFSRPLMAHIKSLTGSKWHGYDDPTPRKLWSVKDNEHNRFQLQYLNGEQPYARYEQPLPELPETDTSRLPMYEHQRLMVQHGLRGRHIIIAGEMGLGKSRAFIEMMEIVRMWYGLQDCQVWYVGPRAGVKAVGRELVKWNSRVTPVMLTYNGLVQELANWQLGDPAPKMICFDESSKIKNATSQRGQAAAYITEAMRDEWGEQCYILEMSGTPSPRTPVDWHHQCEVACPGFLKEGDKFKFKARLCLTEMQESIQGHKYPKLITWLDDEEKCAQCGEYSDHINHRVMDLERNSHVWQRSINQVQLLHKRMHGLVLIQFKKDCLDLPEKQYQRLQVRPTIEIIRAARLIRKRTTRAITALMLLRELSDGFQYTEIITGQQQCPNCLGQGRYEAPVPIDEVKTLEPQDIKPENFTTRLTQCILCDGGGTIDATARDAVPVPCPKDDVFIDLLDEHEEVGRFIVWGGFTGTVNRLSEIAQKQGWYVLRVDGRGYHGFDPYGGEVDSDLLLDAMDESQPKKQELRQQFEKVCFVGNPEAGGMALTLTASPTTLYFSNTFNGEARMQSEDRFHRAGMDVNRGCTVIDLVHLPSDLIILNNLIKKRKLQNLTMGNLDEMFAEYEDK